MVAFQTLAAEVADPKAQQIQSIESILADMRERLAKVEGNLRKCVAPERANHSTNQ